MRALIDENLLSPIKFDPDNNSPDGDKFRLKVQPVQGSINQDLDIVLEKSTPLREQKIAMPKRTPGKRDSFSEEIGFPTPEKKPAALPSP